MQDRPYTKHGKQAEAVLRFLVRDYILEAEHFGDPMENLMSDGVIPLLKDFELYWSIGFGDTYDKIIRDKFPLSKYRTGE